jgi:undecaprenyl diphosphate synthase
LRHYQLFQLLLCEDASFVPIVNEKEIPINVIFISLDNFRADALSVYGNTQEISSSIDSCVWRHSSSDKNTSFILFLLYPFIHILWFYLQLLLYRLTLGVFFPRFSLKRVTNSGKLSTSGVSRLCAYSHQPSHSAFDSFFLNLAALLFIVIDVFVEMTDSKIILPRHLAIIMDGNGRWAQSRGLPRIAGHKKGADSVRNIVKLCRKRGIQTLSLFAFSAQNWNRPSLEVTALMQLLASRLVSERLTIMNNGIRLTAVGELDRLPPFVLKALDNLISESSSNTDMTLCLCLSYGGKEEIVSMVKQIGISVYKGDVNPEIIDESLVERFMWSKELGPVDFLIRTSGEFRISNFFLWSIAYSELYFSDCFWPDFDETALDQALNAFQYRNRRFGLV